MKKLNPAKLTTTFRGVTPIDPVIPRRYTLTHSDITAQLFLTIGLHFAFDEIGPMRDEVMGEWCEIATSYIFYAHVQVDTEFENKAISATRYKVFKREMPLALEAIRFGDQTFFKYHSALDYIPIWIHFHSIFPEFNVIEYWGTLIKYA